MSSSDFADLFSDIGSRIVNQAVDFVTQDAWDLIPDDGKADVFEAAKLMAEAGVMSLAGYDVSAAQLALKATLGNWEMAGRIRVAMHGDEFLDTLKEGLMVGAEAVFKIGIRALL